MPSYLRLRVRELLDQAGTNLHRAMQRGGFSYPTMHRYMAYPDQVESLHTPSVLALLVDALGWTPDQIENTRLGHFFEVVTDGEREPMSEPYRFYGWLFHQYDEGIRALGDPILDELFDDVQDRLRLLHQNHVGDPSTDPAAMRRYLVETIAARSRFWFSHAPDYIREDAELMALAQEALGRMEQLADKAAEETTE